VSDSKNSESGGGMTGGGRSPRPPAASLRELVDFLALVMLAIKEETEDLRQRQTEAAQSFCQRLIEIGGEVPGSPAMDAIVSLMQGDDLRNQRQQHVVNALRYAEDLIREQSGRDWEPALSERSAGWGEGLLASQTLEMVRAHFHHYLLGSADLGTERKTARPGNDAAPSNDDIELF